MVPCPLCLAAAFSWAVRLDRDAWCFAAQVSHLVRSGTSGFGQSLQMPSFLASSRLAWATRCSSAFRSGVWPRFRSYFRRFSALALTSSGVGSGWRSGCCAFGVAFLLGFLTFGFLGGFRTGGFLAFWGPPPVFCGFGNVKLNSKVRPTARGSRVSFWPFRSWFSSTCRLRFSPTLARPCKFP